MKTIDSEAALEAALAVPVSVLYKHSPICATSSAAYDEVVALGDAHGDVPIFLIDVIASRALSRLAAQRTGVAHQSPQIIVLREGVPMWYASHYGVQRGAVARQLELLRSNGQRAAGEVPSS